MQILKQAYQACNAKWLSSNNPTYKDLDYLATLMLRAMAHLYKLNLYSTLPTATIEIYRRITKLEINISVSIMPDPEQIGHYILTVEPDLVINKHYKSLTEAVAGVNLAIIDELEYQLKDVETKGKVKAMPCKDWVLFDHTNDGVDYYYTPNGRKWFNPTTGESGDCGDDPQS